eukprot:6172974-Pleurochrysis_carterae.AAC.4
MSRRDCLFRQAQHGVIHLGQQKSKANIFLLACDLHFLEQEGSEYPSLSVKPRSTRHNLLDTDVTERSETAQAQCGFVVLRIRDATSVRNICPRHNGIVFARVAVVGITQKLTARLRPEARLNLPEPVGALMRRHQKSCCKFYVVLNGTIRNSAAANVPCKNGSSQIRYLSVGARAVATRNVCARLHASLCGHVIPWVGGACECACIWCVCESARL